MTTASTLHSHEVLDLVSDADADDEQASGGSTSPSFLRPPRSPPHHAMSDSEAVTASRSPRKRQRVSLSPASSPAHTDDAASVISISSRDTRGSDSERDDDVIDFSDLSEADPAAAAASAVLHTSALHAPSTPAASASAAAAAADEDGAFVASSSAGGSRKKRVVERYFGSSEDLSLKCFNCGSPGHKSGECAADKPCYVCGQSLATHKKRGCPNEPCWRCGGIGHQKNECTAARFLPRLCYRCGSTSHEVSRCTTPPSSSFWDLSAVHCYVCGAAGHINCSPPSFASTPLYCCNCASPYHHHSNCRNERLSRDVAVEEYTGGGSAYKRSMECFRCGQIGHSKAECTFSNSRNRRSAGGAAGTAFVGRSGGAGGMRLSYSGGGGGGGYASGGRSASEKGGRGGRSRERDERFDRHGGGARHRSSSASGSAHRSGEREHFTGRKRKH